MRTDPALLLGAEPVQYAPSQQTENSYESNGEENPEE